MTARTTLEQQRAALQNPKVNPRLAHEWEVLLQTGGGF